MVIKTQRNLKIEHTYCCKLLFTCKGYVILHTRGNHFNPIRSTMQLCSWFFSHEQLDASSGWFVHRSIDTTSYLHTSEVSLRKVTANKGKREIIDPVGTPSCQESFNPLLANCYSIGTHLCFLLRERNETFFSPEIFIYVTTLGPVQHLIRNFCRNEEDYLHYFITCSFLKTF